MQPPPTASPPPFDEMRTNQSLQGRDRRGAHPDERGNHLVAHIGTRRQGQQTQHARLLGRQPYVRQVEGSADIALAVIEVAEQVTGLDEFGDELLNRLAPVHHQQCRRDLESQRQVPAEGGEARGLLRAVRDAAVCGVGDPQGAVEQVVRLLRGQLAQRQQAGAQLG